MSVDDASGRILRSTGAAAVSQLWRVGITFGVQLLLRRTIPPADYGLWDWTFAVFMILGAVRDLGLPAHVVRLKNRPFGNLLWVECVWGGLLASGAYFGAPFLALLFEESDPRLVPVIQAMALFLILEGLGQVALVYFEGELAIGRSLLPEILRNLTFAVVAFVLAWQGYGVWSLVLGQLAASAVFGTMLWIRAWGKIPLVWERGRSLAMMVESLPLGSVWLVMLAMRHVDPLILGARFDAEVVGTYGFAYWVAFLVATLLIHPIGRALYPALINLQQDSPRPFEAYRLATLLLLAVEVPAALFLFLNADLVSQLLGGQRWVTSPEFLRILCFAPLLDPMGRFAGQFLAARHQERLWVSAGLVTLASWAAAGFLLTDWLGPKGMAWANYLPLGAAVTAWAMYRIDGEACRRLVGDLGRLYLIPLPFFAAAALAPAGLWRFGLSTLAAVASFALYYRKFGAGFRRFFGGEKEPIAVLGPEP